MNNIDFEAWGELVRRQMSNAIHDYAHRNGRMPLAVLAGGEYVTAVHRDPERRNFCKVKDTVFWHGVPFVRCSLVNQVVLIGDLETVQLEPVPAREGT